MKVTAGISINNKLDFRRLLAHDKREYKNDKNKNIDPKLSDTNINLTLTDYRKIWGPRVKKYVHNRNQKATKQHNPRRKTTIDKLLSKKYTSIVKCGIITLGGDKFRNLIEDGSKGKTKRLQRKVENKWLIHYAYGFNKRHKHLKIGRIFAHSDEGFIHAHAELISIPNMTKGTPAKRIRLIKKLRSDPSFKANYKAKLKKKGKSYHKMRIIKPKPSYSFSRAVTQEYGGKNNKIAMKCMRSIEDQKIVDTANFNLGGTLSLTRKGYATSESRGQHSKEASAESEADSAKASLAQLNQQASTASTNASQWDSRANSQSLAQARSKTNFERSKARTNTSISNAQTSISKASSSVSQESASIEVHEAEFNGNLHRFNKAIGVDDAWNYKMGTDESEQKPQPDKAFKESTIPRIKSNLKKISKFKDNFEKWVRKTAKKAWKSFPHFMQHAKKHARNQYGKLKGTFTDNQHNPYKQKSSSTIKTRTINTKNKNNQNQDSNSDLTPP